MLLNTLLLALRSIRRNLMRSFLTILGIVIGVSAVITMVTVGNGATLACRTRSPAWAPTCCRCAPASAWARAAVAARAAFKEADAAAIASQIGGVAAAAPEARTGGTVVANGRNWTSSVTGSTNDWLTTGNWKWAGPRVFRRRAARGLGRLPDRRDRAPRALRQQPRRWATLRVKQISCEIIGLLASKGQGAFGNDQDDMVLMPIKTLQRRITGNNRVNTLLVSMMDGSDSTRVKASLTQLLRERRKLADTDEDNFNVLDTKQLADTCRAPPRS
jgi:putative ABC transport system permease protein